MVVIRVPTTLMIVYIKDPKKVGTTVRTHFGTDLEGKMAKFRSFFGRVKSETHNLIAELSCPPATRITMHRANDVT